MTKLSKAELMDLDFDPTEEPKMYWTVAFINFWKQDVTTYLPIINIGVGKMDFHVYTSYGSIMLFGLGLELRRGINLEKQYGRK